MQRKERRRCAQNRPIVACNPCAGALDFWDFPPPSWNAPKDNNNYSLGKGRFPGVGGLTVGRRLGPEEGAL